METQSDPALQKLLELANNYPSPHNGQPIRVRMETGGLSIYFVTERGLSATPISYLFSFVSIGVFVRHFELCAQALGHRAEVQLALPAQADLAGPDEVYCGRILMTYGTGAEDAALLETIVRRQTSRKKYSAGLTEAEQTKVAGMAETYGLTLRFATPAQAREVIWLNQRAVFDDMFDDKVRAELDHWLRYSAHEKADKKDGLAYDCMELSGPAMRFSVRHYKMLHWPVVAPLLRRYYLRTMQDDSSVGYVTAPFETEQQAYTIGRYIIDMWLELARAGHYLHPFGTIVSNDAAHRDFAATVGLPAETRADYVVFIFRAGASVEPVESERLPVAEHLYNQS